MKSKGFTLIELMVTIVIVGILAGIAVPRLFGHTAKAKASEVTPAAMTYIKLQQAFMLEHKAVGTWKKIGYEAPGKGKTSNFKYSNGDFSSSVKQKNWKTTFSGEGKIGWQAENIVGLDNCLLGNKWIVLAVADGDGGVNFKTEVVSSKSSQYCVALTGNWGTSGIQVAANTQPSVTPTDDTPEVPIVPETTDEPETPIVDEPEPEPEPETPVNPEQVTYKACAASDGNSWLNGVKEGWKNQEDKKACYDLRNQLIENGELVCETNKQGKCTNSYVFASAEVQCRVTGSNCN